MWARWTSRGTGSRQGGTVEVFVAAAAPTPPVAPPSDERLPAVLRLERLAAAARSVC